ncbi:MAG TPA: hypothetical protein VD931_13280 [Baekduia sp.]|nr:hypothetical protein [Baekduia sp.]
MGVAARLALFAVLLAAVFGGAALLGGAVDPSGADDDQPAAHAEEPADGAHGDEEQEADGAHAGSEKASAALPGLAAEQDGLRLVLDQPRRARPDAAAPIRFRIVGDDGRPVRDFDVAHDKRMHLIVVRRDLRGFQHLHPEQTPDGAWETRADLGTAGVHRVFADFTIDGDKHTLGTDLHVAGDYAPQPLPAAATTARAGDLEVVLRRRGSRLGFDVLRDGRVVNDELEPYLGAKGHLVTLRAADLAFLHTHPDGDQLAFDTELPSPGAYRVWVQFQLDGRVHTAAFTQEVTS